MRTKLLAAMIGAGLLLAAVPVWAHHAFAAEFDQNKPLKLKGTVIKWEVSNPHSWIHMEVKGDDGKPVTWMVEGFSSGRSGDRGRRLSGQGRIDARGRKERNVRRRQAAVPWAFGAGERSFQ